VAGAVVGRDETGQGAAGALRGRGSVVPRAGRYAARLEMAFCRARSRSRHGRHNTTVPTTAPAASINDATLAVRYPHSPQTIGGAFGFSLTVVSPVVDVTEHRPPRRV
jgi:hypothetical protein